jgi:flagellar biosynthetic protein FliO
MIKYVLALLLLTSSAYAAGGKKAVPTPKSDAAELKNVSIEEVDGRTLVHFEMNQTAKLSSLEIRFLRRTVEWDMKNVAINKDKLFVDVRSNDINNVYVSHTDDKNIRVRMNLETGKIASNYHERINFTQDGNTLTLAMDKSTPLLTNNIKELSRIYAIGSSLDTKIAEHMNSASVLKVGNASSPTAMGQDEGDDEDIALDEKTEAQIPLKITNKDSKSATTPSWWRMLMGVGVAGILLFSLVVLSKKLNAKRLGAQFNKESITVISQKYLGPKRNLTLIRVAGEYLLLGVTDNNISLIKSLSVVDDEIPDLAPNDFTAAVKNITAKEDPFESQIEDIEDSFSVSSLNDVKKIFKKRKYIDE